MPLMTWATHVLQWRNRGKQTREGERTPKITSQFGLKSATRLHEVGFASNGASAVGAVNTFPGLVHTARHIRKAVCTRSRWPIRKGALWRDCRGQPGGRWGRRQIIMPLMTWATHVLQCHHREGRTRKGERISKKWSQFGLWAATRPHEVGVASNRGSACRGEYVPGSCTHRPSHHGSW